jgi:hypothetical protein
MWNPEMGPAPEELAEAARSSAVEKPKNEAETSENSESVEQAGSPEQEARRENLKPHDLIVADDEVESAMKILKNANIPGEKREIRKRKKFDDSVEIPGEFAIAILESADNEKPADPERVVSAFAALKQSRIMVRFALKPESEAANATVAS